MRTREHQDPERILLVRTRRLITAQIAGAISLVLVLVGVLVYCATVSGQEDSAQRELAAATRGGNIAYPPPCVWLFELRGGILRGSPGAPVALPVLAALDRAAAAHRPVVAHATRSGRRYLVRTEQRGDMVVEAAMDLRYQTADRRRLLRALAIAEIIGLLAALLIGQILARRAIAPLGETLARRRRFVADASHELRTPLTRLHTRAQLVARRLHGEADPGLVAEDADRLVSGTRQLGEVVEDLLLSTQFRQPGRPYGPVDLAVLAAEVVSAEKARAEARGVTIEVRLDGSGDHVVHGAASALRRVISALLDNALGHTSLGGHIWVTLSTGKDGTAKMAELTVRDDGVGFDPRDAGRLFTRFVSGSHGEGRRFGLGLALVREVLDGHGGTIVADGRPGAGATFTVRLPAELARAEGP